VLDAVVASEDGRMVLRESTAGPPQGAEALGVSVAEALLARGAAGVVALRPAGVGDGR
jgi:porphobilinogen deaminase